MNAHWLQGSVGFYDETGNEVTLVRGRIFIQVVQSGAKVRYEAMR